VTADRTNGQAGLLTQSQQEVDDGSQLSMQRSGKTLARSQPLCQGKVLPQKPN
jgi:hypothetical protein